MLNLLPSELNANINGRLDNKSAKNCSLLNKNFNNICKRYGLDKPIVDELKLSYNENSGNITLTLTVDMDPEIGQIERKTRRALNENKKNHQQKIMDWAFKKVRSVKKLSFLNMKLDNKWVASIRRKIVKNRGLECLYLRETSCPVTLEDFYGLMNFVNLLDTDMDALGTVQLGDTTYDEFFSTILLSLSLYGDPEKIIYPKYTLNTLTNAFLPRLIEVLPSQFSLADCTPKINILSIEETFKAGILSGAQLNWQLGHYEGNEAVLEAPLKSFHNNLHRCMLYYPAGRGQRPLIVSSKTERTKMGISMTIIFDWLEEEF